MRDGTINDAHEALANPLLPLLVLGQRARAAASTAELAFLAVNDTRELVAYRQAALWSPAAGLQCLSGVVAIEANAPYAQWLGKVCRALAADGTPGVRAVNAASIAPELAQEWRDWLPEHGVWIPLPGMDGAAAGGLLLAADLQPAAALYPLLDEWMQIWLHAWRAKARRAGWAAPGTRAARAWWRRPLPVAAALLALMFVPVRLTVLAPGELVPSNPATVRAPLDGVIAEVAVRPNQQVKAGQLLFSFDQAPIASRLEVAREALATAQAEYRQAAQMVLSDPRSRGQLAALLGKIAERQAEADYLAGQARRSQVLAARDGMAVFDDPSEWIGRPVQTGERIMQIASESEVEIEAWVPIGDAIPLEKDAEVRLYLAAAPLDSVSGTLRYMSHRAAARPDGSYAYRVRVRLAGAPGQRIGLKGTAKLYGDWAPLGYWMLRRPLAAVRQFIAY